MKFIITLETDTNAAEIIGVKEQIAAALEHIGVAKIKEVTK